MPQSTALFGSSATSRSTNLVEFRTGKMNLRVSDNMVVPDKRQGKLYLYQSEDGLIHLCWKERNAVQAEDDFLICPDDAVFLPVKKCTTGRVFLLRFKAGRKFFFWMQEPNSDRDQEYVKKVNDVINNPPISGSAGRRLGRGAVGMGNSDMQDILSSLSMNQSDLLGFLSAMQLGAEDSETRAGSVRSGVSEAHESSVVAPSPGLVTPAASTGTTGTVAAPKKSRPNTSGSTLGAPGTKFRLEDLQNIFSNLSPGASLSSRARAPVLPEVLKSDNVKPLLDSEEVVDRLLPLTPEGGSMTPDSSKDQKKNCILSTLQSPYFKSAVRTFSSALQTGQIGPVVSQFKLGDSVNASASSDDIVRFAEALEAKEKPATEEAMEISRESTTNTNNDQPPSEPAENEKMDKN